jgi:hypothetical protein
MTLSGKKKKELGSLSDPVVLDDSSDEDEVKSKPPAAKRVKLASQQENKNVPFPGRRTFLLLLLVEPDDECNQFLAECKSLCSPDVHEHCFQREGTLHFSLTQKKLNLTYEEAMDISVDPMPTSLPVMRLTKFKSWPRCIALDTSTSLSSLVSSITPSVPLHKNAHMSLYRMRGNKGKNETEKQFNHVRDNVSRNFGTAKGVRVILKEMGADYEGQDEGRFFRVLVDTRAP